MFNAVLKIKSLEKKNNVNFFLYRHVVWFVVNNCIDCEQFTLIAMDIFSSVYILSSVTLFTAYKTNIKRSWNQNDWRMPNLITKRYLFPISNFDFNKRV